ncbi:MAG: RNB domain-containing ribonuclease, partial [Candidatus Acidiferrales bacterium]
MGVPNQRHPNDPQEESRPPEVSPELVLAHLATLSEPASIRQIAHGMELKHHGRRFLPRVLHRLKKSGDIEETRGNRYKLPGAKETQKAATKRKDRESASAKTAAQGRSQNLQPASAPSSKRNHDPNLIPGRIVAHREGYGFLVPDSPIRGIDGDLFIGRDNLGDAMNGDRVLGRVERRRPDGRAEGRVVQILERQHPTLVGLFRYGPQGNVVLPYDTRILHEVLIPPGDELTPALRQKLGTESLASRRVRLPELDGAVVDVEIKRYPKGGLAPVGRILEILGRPGEIGVDVEIIIRKHHLPHIFPGEVLAEARNEKQEVAKPELAGRRDFRDLAIVTIDGETARDFDDAVRVAPLPNGHFELQVHIADVAHYVPRNSALDREARLRGTSVYFPNRAVPMLPEELSNGICSLNPKVDRLVMSVVMEMDAT